MDNNSVLSRLEYSLQTEFDAIKNYTSILSDIDNDLNRIRTRKYIEEILKDEKNHAEKLQTLINLYRLHP